MAGDTRCGGFLVRYQAKRVGAALWRKADNSLAFKTRNSSEELAANQLEQKLDVEISNHAWSTDVTLHPCPRGLALPRSGPRFVLAPNDRLRSWVASELVLKAFLIAVRRRKTTNSVMQTTFPR